MRSFVERFHAVECKPHRPTPDDDIAMFKPYPPRPDAASQAAEQEYRWKPERDRHNRRIEIKLVSILMQRKAELRARND